MELNRDLKTGDSVEENSNLNQNHINLRGEKDADGLQGQKYCFSGEKR